MILAKLPFTSHLSCLLVSLDNVNAFNLLVVEIVNIKINASSKLFMGVCKVEEF